MKRLILTVIVLLAAALFTTAAMAGEQQALAHKLIRLHVVAHSDSETDQAVKLQVRDAVLRAAEGMNPDTLRQSLPQLREAARDCLRSQGDSHPVEVTLAWEDFPTRVYESFSLPAGRYEALRVTIGDGAGHNWWCVVFPSICLRSAADLEEAAAAAGFTPGEVALITGEEPVYRLKFKVLELLSRLLSGLGDRQIYGRSGS